VFENKLGWASILAMQKGIAFEVSDKTVASEFGFPDIMSVAGNYCCGKSSCCSLQIDRCWIFQPFGVLIR
jgi:hypothetical protein